MLAGLRNVDSGYRVAALFESVRDAACNVTDVALVEIVRGDADIERVEIGCLPDVL